MAETVLYWDSCSRLAVAASLRPLAQLTQTGLEVIGELVAMVTAADRTEGGVLTQMRAASISCLTTINDLHFNTWDGNQRGESVKTVAKNQGLDISAGQHFKVGNARQLGQT